MDIMQMNQREHPKIEKSRRREEYLAECREKIRDNVLEQIDFAREVSDEKVLELIDEEITRMAAEQSLFLIEMTQLRQEVFHSLRKLDVLQDLIEDSSITEIMINGAEHIFIERSGNMQQVPLHFSSEEKLLDVVTKVVSGCNRVVNEASPIADARLPNGDRVNVVLAPAALNGPILTIRRFPEHPIEMKDLIAFGSIPENLADYLGRLVRAGYNIFISGGTGSGKTTFLNALSAYIPQQERVITIEDNAELQIRHIPNLVRLEARNANVDGCIPISIRDLIRTSLRMRPDRIVVGEVRGQEALDMIQAMNTGHDGSMSTGHSNSARDMMSRLEIMVLQGADLPITAIRAQIASAIDLVVHLGRLRDRSRKVLEIAEITGMQDGEIQMQTLFVFEETGERNGRVEGEWIAQNTIKSTNKLDLAGIRLSDE
jgi:pilus assembly protein CpaF